MARSIVKTVCHSQRAALKLHLFLQWTSKNLRDVVVKTEAKLAPGSVQMCSSFGYIVVQSICTSSVQDYSTSVHESSYCAMSSIVRLCVTYLYFEKFS